MANLNLYLFLKKCDFSVVICPLTINTNEDLHESKEIIYSYFYPNNLKIYPISRAPCQMMLALVLTEVTLKTRQKKKKENSKTLPRKLYLGCSLLVELSHGEKTMRGRWNQFPPQIWSVGSREREGIRLGPVEVSLLPFRLLCSRWEILLTGNLGCLCTGYSETSFLIFFFVLRIARKAVLICCIKSYNVVHPCCNI